MARWAQWRPEVPFHQDTAYALDVAVHDPKVFPLEATVGIHRAHSGSRVTTTVKSRSAIENIEHKFELLYRAIQERRRAAGGTEEVRWEVAEGLWRQAHKIAPVQFGKFRQFWNQIGKVSPGYRPPRGSHLCSLLDRLWGVSLTERVINPLRYLKSRMKKGAI